MPMVGGQQAGSQSVFDLLFGKGRGDNAVTQEKERERKAREKAAEDEKKKKAKDSGEYSNGVRGSAAAQDLFA